MSLSSEKFEISTVFLKDALRLLRQHLGRLKGEESISQAEMARLLGCDKDTYRNYEAGRRFPSGELLMKILQSCPDRATLGAFGIDISRVCGTWGKQKEEAKEVVRKITLEKLELKREASPPEFKPATGPKRRPRP